MGSSDATASGAVPERAGGRPTTLLVAVLFVVTLLLAGAAALGVATVIDDRPQTWRSTAVVRLVPGTAPATGDLRADVARYQSSSSTREFTESVAEDAGLSKSTLRGTASVQQRAPGQLGVVVLAATSKDARVLAASAGKAVVRMVRSDQESRETNPRARLRASLPVPSTEPIKTEPRTQDALVGAGLAAGAVLVLGTVVGAVVLNRRTRVTAD